MNATKDIWYGNYVHPDINARYVRLKYGTILEKRKVKGKEQNPQ